MDNFRSRPKLVIGLLIIAFGIWTLSPILSVHAHRATGYEYLHQAFEILGDENPGPDYCVSGGISDPVALELVQKAVEVLEEARDIRSEDAQTLLFLGRGYCLLGMLEEAVEAYERYTELRPENPLGHLELGFGYAWLYSTRFNYGIHDLGLSISTELQQAGIQSPMIVNEGQKSFFDHQYVRAAYFFELSTIIDPPLPQQALFLWNIASVVNNQTLPTTNDILTPPIHIITETTKIEAEILEWVHEGKVLGMPLSEFPTGNPDIGVMWWNGSAIAFVNVLQPGTYDITIRALDVPPAPIKLELEHNFTPIAEFSLLSGNSNWEELETSTYMESGLQIVGVHYVNDEIVNELNRNAMIDWVEFEKK